MNLAQSNNKSFSVMALVKWLAAFLVPTLLYFVLPVDGEKLTHEMAMFLVVTLWAVMIWAMGLMNDVSIGMLLPILYMALCAVPSKVVYASYASEVPNTVIGGFIICKILQDTGLGKRIGLFCMHAMGGSFKGALWGITLAVFIVNPLVPAVTGKGVIFLAIVISLCESLDMKKGSNEATALMMVAFLAVASLKMSFLTGGGDLIIGMSIVDDILGTKTSWMEYAYWNFIPATIYTIICVLIVMFAVPSTVNKDELKLAIQRHYSELGAMSRDEKIAGLIMLSTLLLLCTDKLHGFGAGMVLIAVSVLAFAPKIDLMNADKLKKINFSPIFFIMGCMAIGSAGTHLKATNWLADNTLHYLEGLSFYSAGVGTYIVGVLGNFLLTPLAATVALTGPIVELAQSLGFEPRILYFTFKYGFDNYLFPYEYAVLLLFYGFGYIRFVPMVKILAIRMVITIPFLYFLAIPYWEWIISKTLN